VVVLAPLAVVAIFAVAAIGAGRRAQLMASVLAAYAVAMFVVPAWGRGTWILWIDEGQPLHDATMRYSVVPVFLLVSSLVILLGHRHMATRPVARVGALVLIAWMSMLMAVNFHTATIDSAQANWHAEVSHVYVTKCDGRPAPRLVSIPSFLPVVVPCRQLDG
jgi:hypothetical protein